MTCASRIYSRIYSCDCAGQFLAVIPVFGNTHKLDFVVVRAGVSMQAAHPGTVGHWLDGVHGVDGSVDPSRAVRSLVHSCIRAFVRASILAGDRKRLARVRLPGGPTMPVTKVRAGEGW